MIKIGLEQYLYTYIDLDRPSRESISDTIKYNYDFDDPEVWVLKVKVFKWDKELKIDDLFSSHINPNFGNPMTTEFDIDQLRDIKKECQEKMKVEKDNRLRKVYEKTFWILDKLDRYYDEGKVISFAYETSW